MRATTLEIQLSEPPDWETFEIGSNVTSLTIWQADGDVFFPEKDIIQLAFVIHSHHNISTICFRAWREHLGYFCVAASGKRDKLITLMFSSCTIDRFAASALNGMLKAGSIGNLSFQHCDFDAHAAGVIVMGLECNTSLQKFEYVPYYRHETTPGAISLHEGVLGMLSSNTSITQLHVSMQNHDIYQLCDALGWSSTMQNIVISDKTIDVDSATAIVGMMKREPNKPLKELTLQSCNVSGSALALLLKRCSCRALLQTLTFENVAFEPDDAPEEVSWANLKVESLSFSGTSFDLDNLTTVVHSIADNPYIQNLNLSGVLDEEEKIQLVSDVFLEPNRGPSKLVIDHIGSHGALISNALQHNTSLKALTIAGLDLDSLEAFAEELANMGGLRELYFGHEDERQTCSKTFFENLQQSLEENTSLHVLGIRSIDSYVELAKPFLPRIQYLLTFNRVGRNSLLETDVPLGIWAPVFAKLLDQVDLVYYFVRNKPEVAGNEEHT